MQYTSKLTLLDTSHNSQTTNKETNTVEQNKQTQNSNPWPVVIVKPSHQDQKDFMQLLLKYWNSGQEYLGYINMLVNIWISEYSELTGFSLTVSLNWKHLGVGEKIRKKKKINWCIDIVFIFQSHIAFQMQTHKGAKFSLLQSTGWEGVCKLRPLPRYFAYLLGLISFPSFIGKKGSNFL